MASYVETPCKTFEAGGAIAVYLRVKLSAGVLAVAGLTDRELGCSERPAFANGDLIPVRLRTAQGTVKMVACKAFSAGDPVYTAANGKISDVQGVDALDCGTALDDAAADGDVVEVLRADAGPLPEFPPGSITNTEIDAAAAIDFSKLAALASGHIIVGSAGTVPTSVAMSGDATIIASGAVTIANNAVTTAKILDANVTSGKLAAGAATLPKVTFTGLKTLAHAAHNNTGAVTLTGAVIGDRVIAIFGAPTAGGALVAYLPGTDFEAAITQTDQIQQLNVSDLSSKTIVVILAPATA